MNNKYIRFDWAAKNILRNKADFVVFEGFISVLVKEKVQIVELLDSESNQESRDDKYNRVDIKAKNSKGEIILVEIQQTREKKVFSINILYFNLGEGSDYLYHGQATLMGVHDGDMLTLTEHEREDLKVVSPEDIFPEYYVIRVNEFDKLATDPLEEWMRYLKDEYISPDTTAPGLKEAKERLEYLRMTPEQQRAYDHYVDTMIRDADVYRTQMLEIKIAREKVLAEGRAEGIAEGRAEGIAEGRAEGIAEGRAEGIAEGRAEEKLANARSLKVNGVPVDVIVKSLGLTEEEVLLL